MRPRELPGALALGIPAAIVAHMLLFGQSHQLGGSLQDLFLSGALAAALGGLVFFGSLALAATRFQCGGSILAARLSSRLPGIVPLAGATGFWYALIEAAEPRHEGLPLLAVVAALACAAVLIFFIARAAVRWLAHIAVVFCTLAFAPRALAFAPRRYERRAFGKGRIAASRRFARPPPVTMHRA